MNGTKSRGDDESRWRVERLTRRVCSDRPFPLTLLIAQEVSVPMHLQAIQMIQ